MAEERELIPKSSRTGVLRFGLSCVVTDGGRDRTEDEGTCAHDLDQAKATKRKQEYSELPKRWQALPCWSIIVLAAPGSMLHVPGAAPRKSDQIDGPELLKFFERMTLLLLRRSPLWCPCWYRYACDPRKGH